MRIFHSVFHRRTKGIRSRLQVLNLHRHSLRRLRIIRWISLLFFVGSVVGVVGFLIAAVIVSPGLPNPQQIIRHEGFSTKILDRNGNLLYDVYQNERIVPVTENDLPAYLKQATVATEDKDFYKHGGFDPLGPFRIVINLIRFHHITGASTLTQQLVKNVLLNDERTLPRKFKELLLSMEIEQAFTKDQILTMYLNEAPYGGNARGVGAAAESYFGKKTKDLTLTESAIIAGLPQRPSVYSPYSGKVDSTGQGYWIGRTQGVLRRMREDGYITVDQEREANNELVAEKFDKQQYEIKAPHFVFYVKNLLEQEYGDQVLETGGLKVTTTLDLDMQNAAQQITKEEIDKVNKLKITNGSALVMNPNNGEILAMVGSKDYFAKDIDGQFNVAVDGLRQPGSSIKPVTYLLAFRRGFTPASVIMDTPTTFPGGEGQPDYAPKNYDGKFRGPVQLRFALGSSLNIPAVKLLARVGVTDMLSLAYDMGFQTLAPSVVNQRRFGLSVTLGGGEVHLIDSVSAYSAFANGGTKIEPTGILKIEDQNGKVLFAKQDTKGKQVMTPQEAFLMDHVLSDNNARLLSFGPNSQLNFGERAIAVKTGTTNNQVDNWTIGWTRNAIIGVWVGNNDNSPMKSVASGLTGASPIWRRVMLDTIAKGYKDDAWVIPPGVTATQVDTVSGYPAHDGFPTRAEYIIDGTMPSLPDPIHPNLKLCRGQNKLASEADIARNEFDSKEFIVMKESDPVSKDGKNRWQDGIDSWLTTQGDAKYHPPTETCSGNNDIFVTFISPSDQTNVSGTDVDVSIRTATDGTIDRVEIYDNDALKTTLRDVPYQTKLLLSTGIHKLYAKAIRSDGASALTGDIHIGVGGVSWSPTPSPTATPTPTPTATPHP
ncbi:MAG TPA: transglycosylase domain-containing protein [Patescibacteria group bacterium]|nr:transglycosylase domain-containing protein [Patescibacteria group bacterium]